MFLFPLTSLARAATLGAILSTTPRTAVPRPDSGDVTDTTQLPLTVGVLNHMAAFWTAFRQLPDSIQTDGGEANQEPLLLSIDVLSASGHREMQLESVMNMVAMSEKFPAVAAELKQIGMTPGQWEQYRRSLLIARVSDQFCDEMTDR